MVLNKYKRGVSLVEVVIAISIVTVFMGAILGAYSLYLKTSLGNADKIKASFLLEEGVEVVRLLSHSGWSENIDSLTMNQDYYLIFDDSSWGLTETQQHVDDFFARSLVFEDVYRDGNDRISDSGSPDPNTKKVTINVSWPAENPQFVRSISTYVTNLHSN